MNDNQSFDYDYAQVDADGATVIQTEQKERVFLGILGALVGCLLGGVLIVVLGAMGYIASISGFVMGICALKGYILLGKKISVKGIVITAVLMIVTVYISHMISYGFAVAEVFEVDIFTGISAVPMLLAEDAIDAGMYYKDLAMLYVFTALGAAPTVKNYLKR